MLDELLKEYIEVSNNRDLYYRALTSRLKEKIGLDAYNRFKLARDDRKYIEYEEIISLLSSYIRELLHKASFYVPYRIINDQKEYLIEIAPGDKKRLLRVEENKELIDRSGLYDLFSYQELGELLKRLKINKIILNKEGANVILGSASFNSNLIVISKNKY